MNDADEQRMIQASYAGYIVRENAHAQRLKAAELVELPQDIDYMSIGALGHEARQKLSKVRPRTVGQASRIPGLTPSDVQIVWARATKAAA